MKNLHIKIDTFKTRLKENTLSVLTGGVFASASIASDMNEADAIFESARTANSTFANMSDSQIVDYCNGLEPEQLSGMVNLVHGRHFENLVAESTGGILFETKNHPDTDMILNGTEYSIKSNDTTADGITEFDTYSPQDFSWNDADLRELTTEVLDGDIIDATDAILSGAIGFGTMANLQAQGESAKEWENLAEWEKSKTRAAVIGTKTAGKAAAGTAKSTWGLLKLIGKGAKEGYKAHKKFKDDGGYDSLRDNIKT